MARILIFTPTYDDLLEQETVKSIQALEFDGETEWVLSDENPYPGRDVRNCTYQFQKGRQLALDGGFDGMLTVEHDMIVPSHALQALWDTPAPVVYGTYALRHGPPVLNLWQYVGNRALGMSLSLYPRELMPGKERGWMRVSSAGFGCLLIRREVLEKISFRETGNAPDLPFALDCVRGNILSIGRLDVECGHIDRVRRRTLWPFREGHMGTIARVYALQTMNALIDGEALAMTKGRYYSIPVDDARELERAGYVQVTNEAVAIIDGKMGREVAILPQVAEREMAVSPIVRKRKPRKAAGP